MTGRCLAILGLAVVLGLVVLALLLRPTPPVPPDYSKITIVTDTPWDALTSSGWQWQLRTGKNPPSIAVLSDAPTSPSNVMAMPFEGTQPDTEPMVFWHPMPSATEVYAEWWMKISQSWACNPAGCGKIAFLFPSSGGGDMYMGVYCNTPNGTCTAASDTPMQFAGQLQFGSYAGVPIFANVKVSPILRDRWYHYAFYLKWSSTPEAHDGIWRWWLDDELQGEFTDIAVAMGPAIEFQFAMTKQLVPDPPQQFVWFDHTIVRAPGGSRGLQTRAKPMTPR
jgi:hypothetical protein